METKNVKFVAYLRFKLIYPKAVTKLARGKASYKFDLSEKEWQELKMEFDRSDFLKYAQCIDSVIDMAY